MILFNVPCFTGKEKKYISQAINSRKLSGDGSFTQMCHKWFEYKFKCQKALLTTSATHALEMAAMLAGIKKGDEVIMPSYTFVSTANAFVLRGAKVVFIDIRPDTMNIDEKLIKQAITSKTKAIVVVHYAGVGCEMDVITEIAKKKGLLIIEDAAQGVMAKYKSKYLGTIGDIGCYSFHETKNYVCGEGGAIILNDKRYIEQAEIIREKGTNRSRFHRGQIDKYTWVDLGSSYLPGELNAAYLFAQLERAEEINKNRLNIWKKYYNALKPLAEKGLIDLPFIPEECQHNGHMFYIKVKDINERTELINYFKRNDIFTVFHYIPLHSAEAGRKFGRFHGEDKWTTIESERLLRLPLYYRLKKKDQDKVINTIHRFYS